MLVGIRQFAQVLRPLARRIPTRLKLADSLDDYRWHALEKLAHRPACLRMLASNARGEVVHGIFNRKLRVSHGDKIIADPREDVDEVIECCAEVREYVADEDACLADDLNGKQLALHGLQSRVGRFELKDLDMRVGPLLKLAMQTFEVKARALHPKFCPHQRMSERHFWTFHG